MRRFCAAGFAALLLQLGCASPGVPRPPSLHLPTPVRDLSALRAGGSVELRFTAPEETTDRQALTRKGVPVPLTAVVCRVQGPACLSIARLPVAPGETVATVDALPPALTVGPARAVAYRVRMENAAGRDAGFSRDAMAVAGAAPAAITALQATTVAQGIQLTWHADAGEQASVRVESTADAPRTAGTEVQVAGGGASSGGKGASSRLLHVPEGRQDPGGAIDPAPAAGARVLYRVYRERQVPVNGRMLPLRGETAVVTAVRSADVFAPAAPLGLLAVSLGNEGAGPAISLSWEAAGEPDVAGYYVYRALGTGAFARVTPQPVAGVSFEDTAANGLIAGAHARYAVTAVDRNGNESARSAVTEVDVR